MNALQTLTALLINAISLTSFLLSPDFSQRSRLFGTRSAAFVHFSFSFFVMLKADRFVCECELEYVYIIINPELFVRRGEEGK